MAKPNQNHKQRQLKPAILQKIFLSKSPRPEKINASDTTFKNRLGLAPSPSSPGSSSHLIKKRFKKNPTHKPSPLLSTVNENENDLPERKRKRESQVEKMRNRLSVGQFRYISEQLYTQNSEESSELFREKPELFYAYQRGYIRQQRQWPSNPLDAIISELQQEIRVIEECGGNLSPFVITDFGCGDARLARTILGPSKADDTENSSSAKVVVHSFDFVAANEHVVACDMAHTSLNNCSVDVVIFCLSLMGTNITDFLLEANRVLKNGGRLQIAEVRSRFDSVAKFVKKLKGFGFKLTELRGTDVTTFFTHFTFVKVSPVKRAGADIKLAPCVYKKR